MSLETFTRAYLACALWSSNDESTEQGGEPLDRNYSVDDFSPDAREQAKRDCQAFRERMETYLRSAGDDEQNGHDFWLTRNGHGAGFWDRGYPAPIGDRLTEESQAFGEVNPYVGDDGKVHLS